MRALAFFFACYFALLGGWFCQEVEPSAAATSVTVVKAAPSGGRTSRGEADWCSPLCQCHCSAGFALPTALLVAFTSKTTPTFPASRFTSLLASTLVNREGESPWQPPRA